jgi:membrane-associated phospholipid phosphatase
MFSFGGSASQVTMRCSAIKISVLLSLFSAAINSQPVLAANSDSTSVPPQAVVLSDLNLILGHSAQYIHNVREVNQTQLLTIGALLGLSGALMSVDKPIQSLAVRNRSSFNDDLFQIAEQYGAAGTGVIISGSVYTTGILFGDTEIRKTGIMMFEALIWSGIATNVFKSAFGRSRPYMNEGNGTFRPFQFKAGTTSLPSGHTTVAFAMSSVLSECIHNTAVSLGLYSLASLTALARVYHNVHWFSDTFLGAAIGTVAGIAIVHFNEKEFSHSTAHVHLVPNGIVVALQF